MQPLNRYKATYKGELPTRVATEPTGSKVDVQPGESVNVHAAVAGQLRGSQFWDIETAEMGEQEAGEVKRKKEEAAANAKREEALKEELRKKEEKAAADAAKKAADKKKDEPEDEEEDEESDDEDKSERKGKTVKVKKAKK